MALPDPFTIAANAPTPSLVFAKTRFDGYGSERVDTGGNGYSLIINHTPGKGSTGNRHYMKISRVKDAVNPYTSLTSRQTANVSLSIARPSFGFTDAEIVSLVQALIDSLLDSEVTTARLIQMQS